MGDKTENHNVHDIPRNLRQLCQIMKVPEYMQRYASEDNRNGIFDIHIVDDVKSYAAFHSAEIISQIPDRSDCKIFFYYCKKLIGKFHQYARFEGIEHILMVYINHKTDRITPFGYFLLPSKDEAILESVIQVTDQWLNQNGSAITIAKCTTLYDPILQHSLGKIWTTTKLIGCSDEYQKDIKLFAKQNKGLGAPHKTESTRLACTLCYVPQMFISSGIDVVEKRSSSEYGTKLIEYLRANWMDRLISVFEEKIIHRSVIICERFDKRIERDYFQSEAYFRIHKKPLAHVWDFIEFLRSLSKVNYVETMLDGTKLERSKGWQFNLNTKLQKENEARIWNSINEFNVNIELLSKEKAIEQFMITLSMCSEPGSDK